MNTSGCAQPLDRSIGFALLAAGGAERFGSRKLLADLGGKPLWRWAAASAEAAGFVTRFLIVGDTGGAPVQSEIEGWTPNVNYNAQEGIASSIRLACEVAHTCQRLVIALADMPFVEPDHLRSLALGQGLAFTRYQPSRDGVPAAFPRDRFAALASLYGDRGAAAWAIDADRASVWPPWADSLFDVDTVPDLERARTLSRRRSTKCATSFKRRPAVPR